MKKMLAGVAALSLFCALPSNSRADERAGTDRGDLSEARESLADATNVYKEVAGGRQGSLPESIRKQAKCVAIFPKVVTVSLGIGGTHSDGVGFCKTKSGQWENPMFLNLTGGNIGLQAGVKSADVVMFLTGDEAANDLRAGRFRVGGNVSAVAGSFDRSFSIPAAQVVAYSRTEGLFAGASVDGVNINRDEDTELAFYGVPNPSMTAALPSDREHLVGNLRDQLPSSIG
jgi:lipid-binding SYLF domain-containing protein